jgi:hypothetical protein
MIGMVSIEKILLLLQEFARCWILTGDCLVEGGNDVA